MYLKDMNKRSAAAVLAAVLIASQKLPAEQLAQCMVHKRYSNMVNKALMCICAQA
jgi:hypothetical protein